MEKMDTNNVEEQADLKKADHKPDPIKVNETPDPKQVDKIATPKTPEEDHAHAQFDDYPYREICSPPPTQSLRELLAHHEIQTRIARMKKSRPTRFKEMFEPEVEKEKVEEGEKNPVEEGGEDAKASKDKDDKA